MLRSCAVRFPTSMFSSFAITLNKGTLDPGGNQSVQDTYFTSPYFRRYNKRKHPREGLCCLHTCRCTIALTKKARYFTTDFECYSKMTNVVFELMSLPIGITSSVSYSGQIQLSTLYLSVLMRNSCRTACNLTKPC